MIDIDPTKGPVYSGAGQRKDANPIRNDSNDSTGAYQTKFDINLLAAYRRYRSWNSGPLSRIEYSGSFVDI